MRTPSHRQQPGHTHASNQGHTHLGHGDGPPPTAAAARVRRRAAVVLAAIVVPLAVATAVAVALLWPDGHGPQDRRLDTDYHAPGGSIVEATVASLKTYSCSAGESQPGQQAAGGDRTCVNVRVRLDTGPKTGARVTVDLPPETDRTGVSAGDRMRLLHVAVGEEKADYYAFVDFIRGVPMAALAIAYALVVVAVARLRGLRALLGLGFAYVMLASFMLPALLEGTSPLLVGLAGSAAIMFIVLYFAHGFSARTTTALLGTLFGLALTTGLAGWATNAARLTGLGGEDSFILLSATDTLDLSEIVICGIISPAWAC